DVADIVALTAPVFVRPLVVGREPAGLGVNRPDELDVVVVERGGVFLHAPGDVYDVHFDVVRRVRLLVGAIHVAPGVEGREHLREVDAAHPGHVPLGQDPDVVNLVIDHEAARLHGAGKHDVAGPDGGRIGDRYGGGDHVVRGAGRGHR